MLAKLNWRFHSEKSSLWVRVLTNKYRRQGRIQRRTVGFSSCSSTWVGLKKGEDIFSKGSKWIAGKDSLLSLWFDKWLNMGTLRSLISGPLNRGEEFLMLKDISGFFGWNWESLSFVLPAHIQLEIKATPLPFSSPGGDRLSWFSCSNGDFQFKEAYRLTNWEDNCEAGQSFSGDWIWRVQSLPKIKCSFWQCCHHSIPVRAILSRRGIDIPFLCPMCNNAPETITHTLRDCPMAQMFWNSLNPPIPRSLFYGASLLNWLKLNCQSSKISTNSSIDWSILFPFALWSLWLHRNSVAFDRAHNHQDLKAETLAKATKFLYLGINGKQVRTKQKIQVRWQCPPPNWFKLNTDGSSLGNPSLAGGGGLIRNEKGDWVKGFARAIRTTTSVVAKLWALRDGIKLCIALKLQAVVIELDSKLVVDLLKKELNNPNDIDVLVADCRNCLRNIPIVRI